MGSVMKEFKDIIVGLRNEKDLTQEELSKKLEIAKSTIAMWETGDRTPTKTAYEAIADFFNVDIDYLYGRTDIRKKVHFDEIGNEYIHVSEETATLMNMVFADKQLQRIISYYSEMNKNGKNELEQFAEFKSMKKGNN